MPITMKFQNNIRRFLNFPLIGTLFKSRIVVCRSNTFSTLISLPINPHIHIWCHLFFSNSNAAIHGTVVSMVDINVIGWCSAVKISKMRLRI